MTGADWWTLLALHLSLSPLAVGGAMTLAPELHRTLVLEHRWLSDPQFQSCVTLAQATPGPNVLYIALVGWTIGLESAAQAAPWVRGTAAVTGLALSLAGVLLPSSLLSCGAARWMHRHQERRAVQAFRQGLAPVVVGLMLSTAWLLGRAALPGAASPLVWLGLATGATLLVWRTRLALPWLMGAGALAGWTCGL